MSSEILRQQIGQLRKQGLILPRNHNAAVRMASGMTDITQQLAGDLSRADTAPYRAGTPGAGMRRAAGFKRTATGSDAAMAIPRFYDPLEYWDLSGLPWNMADEGHRHKLHKWMRLFYMTHYLVPILIDIFTRFPLSGLEMYSPDPEIERFYTRTFLEDLKYEDFLVNLGREYWLCGEAFALGQFNEDLGVWDNEELVNPESIVIENFPLLNERQLKVVPPEDLVRLAQTKQPSAIYKTLADNFPDFIPYLLRNEPFPVSDVLLKQVAFKTSTWDDHGTPILLRGLRTLIHEEKLLASQDAIAERLYSPLILAKLGYPPTQQSQGFMPGPEQLEMFRDDMDMALSSDFRFMAYHYALEMETVFGRESVPDLGGDFDRIERRLMQIFGINPSLLAGGASGDPYASSALHAEFMNQMLRTFQKYLKEHFRERALVVAEANGHYEYEKRGQTRVPVMERVVEYDDDGSMHVRERPKLMVPELQMQVLDMRDEATERQFLQSLRQMGVPISDERLMVGVSFEYKDSLDEMMEERVQVTVAQQSAKLRTYKALKQQGLPIPPALKAEVEAPDDAAAGQAPPGGGGGPLGGPPPGGGDGMGLDMPPPGDLGPGGIGGAPEGGGPPPAAPLGAGELDSAVPAVSNERRPGMPMAAAFSADIDSQIEDAAALIDQLERSKRDRRGRAASLAPQPLTRVEEHDRIIVSGVLPKQYTQPDPLADLNFDLP